MQAAALAYHNVDTFYRHLCHFGNHLGHSLGSLTWVPCAVPPDRVPLAAKRAGASCATGAASGRTTMRQLFAAAVMLAAAAMPAAAQDAPSAAVLKDLAPTGKLRTGINFGNPVLAQKGPNGEPRGVSAELAAALAAGTTDVGFFAIEPVGAAAAGIPVFIYQKLDAAAGVREPVDAYAKEHPEMRVMKGAFEQIGQAMGTVKGCTAGAAYVRAFVQDMKANGFVADALKRSGQKAPVAPKAM